MAIVVTAPGTTAGGRAFPPNPAYTPAMRVSGTEGYAETADRLVEQYESRTFADVHKSILSLIPTTPCRALDIGAGTGRDAAALAAMGHSVLAVEPTEAMRAHGSRKSMPAANASTS
jgi:protein-L-isoaspartate O-methyltransferase